MMGPMWVALLVCLGAAALGLVAAVIIWKVWFAPLYRKDGE